MILIDPDRVTPLNLVLIPVFMHYGGQYFTVMEQEFNLSLFLDGLKTNTIATLLSFKTILLNGVLAWIVCLPIMTAVCYVILLPLTKFGIERFTSKKGD